MNDVFHSVILTAGKAPTCKVRDWYGDRYDEMFHYVQQDAGRKNKSYYQHFNQKRQWYRREESHMQGVLLI